jgi:hypothetical protein
MNLKSSAFFRPPASPEEAKKETQQEGRRLKDFSAEELIAYSLYSLSL